MKNLYSMAVLLVSALVLGTCATLSSVIKEPKLSLHSAEITGIDFTGIDVSCKVNVENPNRVEIPFPNAAWSLSLAGSQFVSGTVEKGAPLKPGKTVIVDVAFHVDYANVYQTFVALKEASQSGDKETDYQVNLSVAFELPVLGPKTLPFTINGKLPLLQMPRFSDMNIALDTIDFKGVSFACTFNVENPNVFDIPLPKMDWDYKVNQASFISSSIASGGAIAAATVTPITIKLSIEYAKLYGMFQALNTAGEASGDLGVTSDPEIPAFAEETTSQQGSNKIPLLKAPTITFKGITVKPIDVAGSVSGALGSVLGGGSAPAAKIDFDMGFDIENKNTFDMQVSSLSYKLKVNGTQWVEGSSPARQTIRANQKGSIPLSLSINAASLVKDIVALVTQRKSNVPYSCEGGITVAGSLPGLKPLNLPFNLTGTTRF